MPLEDDDYVQFTADELYDRRASKLESVSNGDAEDFEGSAIQSLLATDAEIQSDTVETALDELYDAAYVETASGANLDRKVRELGISRLPSVPATSVARFARTSEPSTTHTIKSNLTITTVGGDVDFLTTESGKLDVVEGFNTSSLPSAYDGDTSSFSTQSSTVDDGSHALEAPSTSGKSIRRTDVTVSEGGRLRASLYLPSNAKIAVRFGVEGADNYYAGVVDEPNGTLELIDADGGTESSISSTSLTVPTSTWITLVIDWQYADDVELTLEDSTDSSIASVRGAVDDADSGGIGFESRDGSTTKYVDTVVRTATALTIEGARGGEQTNVGADRITVFGTQPTGVDSVTNPVPAGDDSFTDTQNRSLVVGRNEETDEQLRRRALSGQSGRGPTTNGLETAIIDDTEGVVSATAFENDTTSTDGQGRPPLSIELVVYGGTDEAVGNTLHDIVGLTTRTTGGHVGSSASQTITDSFTNSDETYEWSRPTFDDLDITVDLVIDGSYVGDTEVKDTLVEYVGGTATNGTTVRGTLVGENVRVDAIRDRLVGPEMGIRGLASITIDETGDGSDDTTTGPNGLTVYDVSASTVARTDGTDGSITVTTTQV